MHIWQLCHLGMVIPLADAYYQTENPKFVGQDKVVRRKTTIQLKKNLNTLSPVKMHIFRYLPTSILIYILSQTFKSSFGNKFMYQHSMKAPDEMRELYKQFYYYIKEWRL